MQSNAYPAAEAVLPESFLRTLTSELHRSLALAFSGRKTLAAVRSWPAKGPRDPARYRITMIPSTP